MPMFSERYGWKPIDSAPVDQDVALIVTDGGEPYLLKVRSEMTFSEGRPDRAEFCVTERALSEDSFSSDGLVWVPSAGRLLVG